MSIRRVCSLGASLTVSGGSLCLGLVLYIRREAQTVTYPTKGCTLDVQIPRRVSTKVLNLSKGEMCFNFSLSISV
jgi:hypothetical protein